MQIVIPGALPNAGTARELTPHLVKTAPNLVRRFEGSHARSTNINLLDTACTSLEYWLLQHRGFLPENSQNMSAGLGPLWAQSPVSPDQAVWLAELVHVSPSRDGAGLLPAAQLAITPEQSLALFQAAKPLFDAPGFELTHTGAARWRITLPADILPASVSPQLVSATRVNDWWPQDTATRPLRRLVNELQMTWYEHPVNQERAQMGLAPINSLWVFGGASPAQLTRPDAGGFEIWHEAEAAFAQSDWAAWLQAMAAFNTRVAGLGPDAHLVLLGEDRIVTLEPPSLGQRLLRLLPGRTNWSHWWSPRNS